MTISLDTSVVVRLLVKQPESAFEIAKSRLSAAYARGETVMVTDLAIAEAFYALRHHYKVPRDEALDALQRFVASGIVQPDPAGCIEAINTSSPAGFVDRLIHMRSRILDCTLLTFDREQARLDNTELLG